MRKMMVLEGVAASPGVAEGPAHIVSADVPPVVRGEVPPERVDDEVQRFDLAVSRARAELVAIHAQVERALGPDQASIFEAKLMFLDDPEVRAAVVRGVRDERVTAAWVYQQAMEASASRLESASDAYLAERAFDMRAVARRVLHHVLGGRTLSVERLAEPVVVVAATFEPADLFSLDPERVLGLATDTGGPTSHLGILARSLGVPAVVGLRNVCAAVEEGVRMVVDGDRGTVTVGPDAEVIRAVKRRRAVRAERRQVLAHLRDAPAVTTDGRRATLRANIEVPDEAASAIEAGAEGVGLFRTEYLAIAGVPSEEAQYRVYRAALERMAPHPVVIRTFDMGGDKFTPVGAPAELNPFLGWRSLRVSLDRPDEFRAQLRAMLRAGVHGRLEVMFPFVSDPDDVRLAREQLEIAAAELDGKGIERAHDVGVGAMMEVPSACIMAESILPLVDFVSIGTNDLTQYTLAVDRVNSVVASRYDPFHPAVLSLVARVIESGERAGVRVAMCGELAADPAAAPLLLGLGLREWSMSSVFIPGVKEAIRGTAYGDARALAGRCLSVDSAREVHALVRESASDWEE